MTYDRFLFYIYIYKLYKVFSVLSFVCGIYLLRTVKIAIHAEYRTTKNRITRDYSNARQRSIRRAG